MGGAEVTDEGDAWEDEECFMSKTGRRWEKNPPQASVRRGPENIFREKPDRKEDALKVKSIRDAFEVFIT